MVVSCVCVCEFVIVYRCKIPCKHLTADVRAPTRTYNYSCTNIELASCIPFSAFAFAARSSVRLPRLVPFPRLSGCELCLSEWCNFESKDPVTIYDIATSRPLPWPWPFVTWARQRRRQHSLGRSWSSSCSCGQGCSSIGVRPLREG